MLRRLAVLTALVVLAGCAADPQPGAETSGTPTGRTSAAPAPSSVSTAAPSASPSPTARTGTRVITADSAYGRMLYDRTGQPIYLFDKEATADPECYGACAEAWPPVLTKGEPRAVRGARQALLGTTTRRGGDLQVTYAGHPLYFYAHEGKYQVLCHDVEEYGGVWLVVRPEGQPAS